MSFGEKWRKRIKNKKNSNIGVIMPYIILYHNGTYQLYFGLEEDAIKAANKHGGMYNIICNWETVK